MPHWNSVKYRRYWSVFCDFWMIAFIKVIPVISDCRKLQHITVHFVWNCTLGKTLIETMGPSWLVFEIDSRATRRPTNGRTTDGRPSDNGKHRISRLWDGSSIIIQVRATGLCCRYRSFTRQYFRKADGVLVMYDVTSASSFHNVRDWMSSIQVCKSVAVAQLT